MSEILTAARGSGIPKIETDSVVAGLSSLRTGELRIGLGLTILAGVVTALGGNPDTLKAGFKGAKSLALELKDIREDRVNVTSVEQYLARADLNPSARHSRRLLHIGAMYLIVATLKSSQLEVEADAKTSVTSAAAVGPLQAAGINGQVSLEGGTQSKMRVSYVGNQPLVFGFKAIQLSYREGRFERYKYVDPKSAKLSGSATVMGPGGTNSEFLLPDSAFLELE